MNVYHRSGLPSLKHCFITAIVAVLCVAGFHAISVSFGEPVQTTKTEADKTANKENEQLERNQVSVKKSRIYTFVEKTGLGHRHGVEGQLKSGSIDLGLAEDAGELVFDMTSFDADTDDARKYLGLDGSTDASTRDQVNVNMKNTAILNTEEFPTATFTIMSAKLIVEKNRDGKAEYELAGDFTLKGKKRPLKFLAEVEQKDGMKHVKGEFSILQTQYGITPFKKALGAVGVADKLTIHGDLWLAM